MSGKFGGKWHSKHTTFIPGSEDFLEKIAKSADVKSIAGGKIHTGLDGKKRIQIYREPLQVRCHFFADSAKEIFYFKPNGGGIESAYRAVYSICRKHTRKTDIELEAYPIPNIDEDANCIDLSNTIECMKQFQGIEAELVTEIMSEIQRGADPVQHLMALFSNIASDKNRMRELETKQTDFEPVNTTLTPSMIAEFLSHKCAIFTSVYWTYKNTYIDLKDKLGALNDKIQCFHVTKASLTEEKKGIYRTMNTELNISEESQKDDVNFLNLTDKLRECINKQLGVIDNINKLELDKQGIEKSLSEVELEIAKNKQTDLIVDKIAWLAKLLSELTNDDLGAWWDKIIGIEPAITLSNEDQILPAEAKTTDLIDKKLENSRISQALKSINALSAHFIFITHEDNNAMYAELVRKIDKHCRKRIASTLIRLCAADCRRKKSKTEHYLGKFAIDNTPKRADEIRGRIIKLGFVNPDNGDIDTDAINNFCKLYENAHKRRERKVKRK